MATALGLTNNDVQGLCQRYWSEQKSEHELEDKDYESTPKVLSFELKPVSETPCGFLSFQYFLNVNLARTLPNGDKNVEVLRFFTKIAPLENTSRMHYLDEFGVFQKEIRFYRDVLPAIEAITPEIAPKCYYAANNILVFQDLSLQGYKMAAGRDGLLDYEHLKCAVETLAALHAGSIIHDVRSGKNMNEIFAVELKENSYPLDKPKDYIRIKNFTKATEVMLEIIKNIPKYSENLDLIFEQVPKRMRTIFELAKVSTKYQNVLSHADLWANNVMFQYEAGKNEPKQCRFVDFQLARYAPPMLDLVTILTIPTTRSFRAQYLRQLLDDYYRSMSEFLKSVNLQIADYLPSEQFEQTFIEFRIGGLIESILFSHLTMLPSENVDNLTGSTSGFEDFFDKKRVEICMKAFNTDETYHNRLADMIEDFVDNFVLKK